jgi:hypothetical protein
MHSFPSSLQLSITPPLVSCSLSVSFFLSFFLFTRLDTATRGSDEQRRSADRFDLEAPERGQIDPAPHISDLRKTKSR